MPLDFSHAFASLLPPVASAIDPVPEPMPGKTTAAVLAPPRMPRTPRDSALTQLKALGPRLTSAQRTSISILESFEGMRAGHMSLAPGQPMPGQAVKQDHPVEPPHRPSFRLVESGRGNMAAKTASGNTTDTAHSPDASLPFPRFPAKSS